MQRSLMYIQRILTWALTIFLGLLFLFVGAVKLASARGMVQEFAEIGLGQWLRYVVGLLEVTGALGLFIPKFRFWAALLLACVMVGATATNLAILHMPGSARLTTMLLILTLAVAWLRRPVTGRAAELSPN